MMTISPGQRSRIEAIIRRAAGSRLPESKIIAKVESEVAKIEAKIQAKATARAEARMARAERSLQEREEQRQLANARERKEREQRQQEERERERQRELVNARQTSPPVAIEATVVATDPGGDARSGLHIRPAAMLARRLAEECPSIEIEAKGPHSDRFYPVSTTVHFLRLGAKAGDEIDFRFYGSRHEAALALGIAREVLEGEPLSAIPPEELITAIDPDFDATRLRRARRDELPSIVREITRTYIAAGERKIRWDAEREVTFGASLVGAAAPI